jgi:hypothetical protein
MTPVQPVPEREACEARLDSYITCALRKGHSGKHSRLVFGALDQIVASHSWGDDAVSVAAASPGGEEPCPTCGGSGEVIEDLGPSGDHFHRNDPGDRVTREWPCPDCKETGLATPASPGGEEGRERALRMDAARDTMERKRPGTVDAARGMTTGGRS